MRKKFIYLCLFVFAYFLVVYSCINPDKKDSNEITNNLTPEEYAKKELEQFKLNVEGTWVATGLNSDDYTTFLPNGKNVKIVIVDAETKKVKSEVLYGKWEIKEGYYVNERSHFFYVVVDGYGVVFIQKDNIDTLFQLFENPNEYMVNGRLEFIMKLCVESEHSDYKLTGSTIYKKNL